LCDSCWQGVRGSMIVDAAYRVSCIAISVAICFIFFFLVTAPPPGFTLFPYTTLSRSHLVAIKAGITQVRVVATNFDVGAAPATRSEEHTSELQSLRHLVCRLLLEKKKDPTNPDAGVEQLLIVRYLGVQDQGHNLAHRH